MKEKGKKSTINLDKNKRERERHLSKFVRDTVSAAKAAGRRVNTKNEVKKETETQLH